MLWRTAVSISIPLIPYDPSPCRTTTCVLGRATFARDGHVGLTVVVELGRVDVDVDDLGAGGEPRRPPELDDEVEAGADDEEHVHLAECLGAGIEERELVVFRHGAAGERRRVE